MLKFKIRVLVSFFCIISSCILTMVYLFSTDDKMNTQIIASIKTKSNTISNNLKVEEIDTTKDVSNELVNVEENNEKDNNTDNKTTNDASVEEINVTKEEKTDKVYEGMTLDELASKLDRSFKNELSGKGYLYASYSLEKGVDPYLAAAISLEETGCNWNCSNLVKTCNNVGGMKGTGCGSYGYFNTLDDGIKAFIDNIAKNYVAYGLTTADTMNSKYAENPSWSVNVNNYINKIRNN